MKELNPDLIGTTTSPRAEAGFEDGRSEFPLSSYNIDIAKDTGIKTKTESGSKPTADDDSEQNKNEFRLSRHSDKHPPRTPSPTKAAYLRTGVSTTSAKGDGSEERSKVTAKFDQPPEIIVTDVQRPEASPKKLITPQKQVHINEFLFGAEVSSKQSISEIMCTIIPQKIQFYLHIVAVLWASSNQSLLEWKCRVYFSTTYDEIEKPYCFQNKTQ